MINRAIIDDKKQRAIFKYIETMRNGKQLKLMFGFNWLAGMRCINFAYLQVGDVIDEFGKVRDIVELTPEKNKGHKSCRYYINDELKAMIKGYVKDLGKCNPSRYLFVSQKTRKPYNRNSISKVFTSIYKTFGMECSTHYGRRHFITELLTHGIDITSVKTLVNHSDVSMTARYYNENENMLKNVVNTLSV
ncbi:MAG: site-specific integrase [Alphaproteobacteria bacterium]|nr:site-specific integrase [Alphaproteobacteria bacterium]